jgi:hypothetical protein
MLVRIRWSTPQRSTVLKHQFALAAGALLTPLALAAFTVSFWGFAAEFRWASSFFITVGLFSHWQVWLLVAGIFLLLSRLLNSYGSRAETAAG